ncbi:hypothetical protein [Nocardia brasiliensis]|uniref:hypothetical protein n=1 Tax=Nocardia brasiliensis TaxID=37326 RepID=UPI0024547641|nr:hypothetical protein [Nocardia brasiliensis]
MNSVIAKNGEVITVGDVFRDARRGDARTLQVDRFTCADAQVECTVIAQVGKELKPNRKPARMDVDRLANRREFVRVTGEETLS